TNIDCLLVGDSLGMTMHGFKTTIPVTNAMMALHTKAVSMGATEKFIVADLPFLSFRKSISYAVSSTQKLLQAGAQAVKLEGAQGNLKLISHLVESGVPVVGHLGLTPQSVNGFGGFRVQAKETPEQIKLMQDALMLEEAGCFSIVLECVPSSIATKISQKLSIPTIGIGAGAGCDGQVLVLQDLLGMNPDFKPKFVKNYMKGFEEISAALNSFHKEVIEEKFPSTKESF
ncbi:MAG: 3-methyl-2-oxobutanoate hydroxymethyltransferase, partial [Pseudobdellovibrionaceae bacterium]